MASPLTAAAFGRSRDLPAAYGIAEMERPDAFDDDGKLEHDVAADELAEVADAGPEASTGTLAHADLVDETEVRRLLMAILSWRYVDNFVALTICFAPRRRCPLGERRCRRKSRHGSR